MALKFWGILLNLLTSLPKSWPNLLTPDSLFRPLLKTMVTGLMKRTYLPGKSFRQAPLFYDAKNTFPYAPLTITSPGTATTIRRNPPPEINPLIMLSLTPKCSPRNIPDRLRNRFKATSYTSEYSTNFNRYSSKNPKSRPYVSSEKKAAAKVITIVVAATMEAPCSKPNSGFKAAR